ncbi:hypothetical protein KZP23_15825 [Echinicola marina]|uniref:hypothetical protein n=1 Tax=Echinicola marina TaxID=2859768 RepID=UPI001CF6E437|nr:hypothetical protein [Echinicola marina]UCS92169.1 hypothetical protein KZP23_15825 [Echinicola marina]
MRYTFKSIVLFFLFVCGSIAAQAQGTIDKLKFEEAEKDYENYKYFDCIAKLEELEQKGLKNPKTLYLKILAKSHFVVGIYRYDKIYKGFETANGLRNECEFYLSNYDIEGLEDKYKKIYEISQYLKSLPSTSQEWNTTVSKQKHNESKAKEVIVQAFCNNLIEVKKGNLYRNPYFVKRYFPHRLSDVEILRTAELHNYDPKVDQRIIEMDYDYQVINQPITAAVLWAIMSNDNSYWVNYLNEGRISVYINHGKLGDLTVLLDLKTGYPVGQSPYALTFDQVMDFISLLNGKTNKIFDVITESELEYALRGGHKQRVDTIKKIIGGNKRKGFQYQNYYVYEYYKYPCTTFNRPNEDGMSSPNELGLAIDFKSMSPAFQGALNKEEYGVFFGKSSTIKRGKGTLGLKWGSQLDYSSQSIKDEKGFFYLVIRGEN